MKTNNEIYEKVKQKISIASFIEEETINMKKTNKRPYKIAIVACVALVLVTGGVFAKDIQKFVKDLFANSSDGVLTAVENGYVSEQETETIEASGIEMKVESFLLDDYNFGMTFRVKINEYSNVNMDFISLSAKNVLITNENNDIVFNTHEVNKVREGIDLNKTYKGSYSWDSEKIGEREFLLKVSGTGVTFPKSKKLNVSIKELETCKLIYPEGREEKERITYTGDWNFIVDVPEEMQVSNIVKYKPVSCSDKKTIPGEATLSNTAFKMTLKTTTDKIDYELLHTSTPNSIYDKMPLQKEYIETADGKIFEPAGRSDGDGGCSLSPQNEIDYYQTFNLTNYDSTDTVTVHLFTNKKEEIVIVYEKVK